KPSTSEILERKITIANNAVSDSTLYGCVFTLLQPNIAQNVYQIEQLTLDDDGLVEVAAVHVPTDSSMASIVAKDVMTPALFKVSE
ncbi:hypothetical protein EBT31_12760, partial [bacterium]|nr:hypothetical protein [bacterium]